jgi:hypothetical protein
MRNLTLTIHFCDICQSFVSATKYENTSTMPEYSIEEYADVYFVYGEYSGKATKVLMLYYWEHVISGSNLSYVV